MTAHSGWYGSITKFRIALSPAMTTPTIRAQSWSVSSAAPVTNTTTPAIRCSQPQPWTETLNA